MLNDISADIYYMRLKKLFLIFSLLTIQVFLFSQDLPRGYDSISLGMSVDSTKQALIEHPAFGYHGDSDVSLLPGENRILIETDSEYGHGSNFLERCYFQFFNDYLYIITININQDKMDYYSIFTSLCEKYGDPVSINPSQAKWEDQNSTLYLEKPLTLKYIDNDVFSQTTSDSKVGPAPEEITKDMFLEGL